MSAINDAFAAVSVTRDATCTACGCLCDDIALSVSAGRIIEAERACALGRQWFLADHTQAGLPQAAIAGAPAERDAALDRAAEILRSARSPVVLGLTRTTTEAVAAAVSLSDRIGAIVDWDPWGKANARILAVQRAGRVSATLGEVKNRADLVVFWGVDPIVTHPRHWERYSVEPCGRFIPDGRTGRTVVVVDAQRTATAERADQFIKVERQNWFDTLWTLRALVRGIGLDAARGEQSMGLDLSQLSALVAQLQAARYGALFIGPSLAESASIEAALRLVTELNAKNRFVVLGLGGPGNPGGAEAAMTWQTGYPSGVHFAGGSPRSLPGVTNAGRALERGEADALLIVADGIENSVPDEKRTHLERIPAIIIGPQATESRPAPTVALNAATYGIDAPGTVARCDGVFLPLRPPLTTSLPSDRDLLRAIEARIHFSSRED
jgi:formylmethanofuran dehydrogenase subunit B